MGVLPVVVFAVHVVLGAGVEGSGGGDSRTLSGDIPLAGIMSFGSRLASYSKVRLGLGNGLTGVVAGSC